MQTLEPSSANANGAEKRVPACWWLKAKSLMQNRLSCAKHDPNSTARCQLDKSEQQHTSATSKDGNRIMYKCVTCLHTPLDDRGPRQPNMLSQSAPRPGPGRPMSGSRSGAPLPLPGQGRWKSSGRQPSKPSGSVAAEHSDDSTAWHDTRACLVVDGRGLHRHCTKTRRASELQLFSRRGVHWDRTVWWGVSGKLRPAQSQVMDLEASRHNSSPSLWCVTRRRRVCHSLMGSQRTPPGPGGPPSPPLPGITSGCRILGQHDQERAQHQEQR